MNYDVDYFINKFEAIPEEKWFVGDFFNDDKTKFCAAGHCGATAVSSGTKECNALLDLFSSFNLSATEVNDKDCQDYQQPTPKQRILAALYDIKQLQAVKQAEDIIKSPATKVFERNQDLQESLNDLR